LKEPREDKEKKLIKMRLFLISCANRRGFSIS